MNENHDEKGRFASGSAAAAATDAADKSHVDYQNGKATVDDVINAHRNAAAVHKSAAKGYREAAKAIGERKDLSSEVSRSYMHADLAKVHTATANKIAKWKAAAESEGRTFVLRFH